MVDHHIMVLSSLHPPLPLSNVSCYDLLHSIPFSSPKCEIFNVAASYRAAFYCSLVRTAIAPLLDMHNLQNRTETTPFLFLQVGLFGSIVRRKQIEGGSAALEIGHLALLEDYLILVHSDFNLLPEI
jgi:hypothetical protein